MSLVMLKDTKGNKVHLNPKYVLFVSSAASGGSPLLRETAIQLHAGPALLIDGTLEEVVSKLEGNYHLWIEG